MGDEKKVTEGLTLGQARTALEERQKAALGLLEPYKDDKGAYRSEAVSVEDREKLDRLFSESNELGEYISAAEETEGHVRQAKAWQDFLSVRKDGNGQVNPLMPDGEKGDDLGNAFFESKAFKGYKEAGATNVAAELAVAAMHPGWRGIGEVKTLFQSSGFPAAFMEDRAATPYEILFQQPNIADLMPQGTTSGNTIVFVKETVTSRGAAAVAEGVAKPEADLTFTSATAPVRKIAVLLPVTDESLEDLPFLRAYLNGRLRLFVQLEEDAQLLNGSGTPPNLTGILQTSGINTATSYSLAGANPDQAAIDSVLKASMRVREAFLIADAVVMRTAVWEKMLLAKDSQRNYLLGGPGVVAPQRLWGLPVVTNEGMPAEVAANKPILVGAFRTGAMVVRRSPITVAISDSHGTFFAENKVAIRVEERLALPVFRPAAFAAITSAT